MEMARTVLGEGTQPKPGQGIQYLKNKDQALWNDWFRMDLLNAYGEQETRKIFEKSHQTLNQLLVLGERTIEQLEGIHSQETNILLTLTQIYQRAKSNFNDMQKTTMKPTWSRSYN